MRTKHRRYAATCAALVAVAVATMAAGGTGGHRSTPIATSASANVAAAKAAVAASRKPVTWKAPGPAFDAAKAHGKLVYDIANTLSLGFTQTLTQGTKQALGLAGARDVIVDNMGLVSNTERQIHEAIAQHASVILIQSVPSTEITAPLKAAKAAHIPVIQLFESDPQLAPPSEKALGVAAKAAFCYSCGGRLMADWAIANSNGNVNAVTFWDSDVGVSYAENAGEKAEFARLCPQCKVAYQNVLVANWATGILPLAESDLTANPSLNYFIPNYDEMSTYIIPAIRAKSAESRVKIISFNADADIMHDLATHNSVVADLGSPVAWMGWGIADQALRILAGAAPVASENVPLRFFDATNVGTINLAAEESTWYGVNYQAKYKALWGVK